VVPFLNELQTLEQQNPNYRFIATMTEMARSHRAWRGETGRIGKEMLSRYLQGAASPVYYLAGTPATVAGLHGMLDDLGIDDDDVRTEEFAGY
jgi:Na+-transporting NADH:ubiquinone oxidoreductase subunit NqrF